MSAPRPVFLDHGWLQRLRDRLADDAEFAHVARWCDVVVELSAPEGRTVLTLRSGHLADDDGHGLPVVRVHAAAERWSAFLSPVPPAWHNDLLGMARRHDDVVLDPGGDTLVRHLRALNRMWEVARAPR